MRGLWIIAAALGLGGFAASGEMVVSQSRQFVVHSRTGAASLGDPKPGFINLEPELLAISAERIRRALLTEVPGLDEASSTVHLLLAETAPSTAPVGISSTLYRDGWVYRVAIPPQIEANRLVRAIVQVLLTEFANRGAGRGAELPGWLVEGMAQHLLFSVGPALVVDQQSRALEVTARDLHQSIRLNLSTNTVPGFGELTTQAAPAPGTSDRAVYESATHLLVRSLLHGSGGRQRLARFLRSLPATLNWQTAFRNAYDWPRMLDVEKWWALAALEFTSRDERQAWPLEVSLQKLDQTLQFTLEFRTSASALPEPRQLRLTQLLEETEFGLHRTLLEEKIQQLAVLSIQTAPEVAALASRYRALLQAYLARRGGAAGRPGLRLPAESQSRTLVRDTVRQTALLDRQARSLSDRLLSTAR